MRVAVNPGTIPSPPDSNSYFATCLVTFALREWWQTVPVVLLAAVPWTAALWATPTASSVLHSFLRRSVLKTARIPSLRNSTRDDVDKKYIFLFHSILQFAKQAWWYDIFIYYICNIIYVANVRIFVLVPERWMNHELFFSLLFGIFIFDSFSKKPFPPRFITKSRLVMEEIESPRPPDVCRRLLPYRAQVTFRLATDTVREGLKNSSSTDKWNRPLIFTPPAH